MTREEIRESYNEELRGMRFLMNRSRGYVAPANVNAPNQTTSSYINEPSKPKKQFVVPASVLRAKGLL